VLVAKSPAGYRATYGEAAGLMLTVDYPGCAPPRYYLPEFEESFSNLSRPCFPWDDVGGLFDKTVQVFESQLVEAPVVK
jgi:hypothetical protein